MVTLCDMSRWRCHQSTLERGHRIMAHLFDSFYPVQQTKHVRCQMIIISVCAITEQISPTKYAQHSQHNHVYGKTPNLLVFTSAPCWYWRLSRCHAHWGAYLGQVTASHNNGGAFVIRIRLILTEWLLSVLHFFRCVASLRTQTHVTPGRLAEYIAFCCFRIPVHTAVLIRQWS